MAFKNPVVGGKTTWIKIISGKEGDFIDVIKLPMTQRFAVFVDDIGKELFVSGFVFLHPSNPLKDSEQFKAFEKDSKGNDLPLISGGVIPAGKYFVTSPSLRSYDSRYWGLVDEKDIIGKAYPVM